MGTGKSVPPPFDAVGDYPHQTGSAIKPLVYACALAHQVLRPDEFLDDTQRVIGGQYIADWDLIDWGLLPAATALAESRNTAAAELTRRLTPEGLAACLHDTFQIRTELHPERYGVKLGIGLAEIPMPEILTTYTILANSGVYLAPTTIARLQDRQGRELPHDRRPSARRVLDCTTTAWIAQALGNVSVTLGLPATVASKTGSTDATSYISGYTTTEVFTGWIERGSPDQGLVAVDAPAPGAAVLWQRYAADLSRAHHSFSLLSCAPTKAQAKPPIGAPISGTPPPPVLVAVLLHRRENLT